MVQKNKSPKFEDLLQNLISSPPNGASEHKHNNSEHRAEDGDNQQGCDQFLPSTELSNHDDTSKDSNNEQSTSSPPFIPQQHTIRGIFHNMKDIMAKPYNNNEGHAYILFDGLDHSTFFKIGEIE
ncbi:hypothetical protein BDV12DRAFT_38955 [Aspergillus spectabilis]